jgi:hypothetical protein
MSSVYVYFKEGIKDVKGFSSASGMEIDGIHIFREDGRFRSYWSEDSPIPENLKDVVDEISCRESIPPLFQRELGIYRCKSAECELTYVDQGNSKRQKMMYQLKVKAKNMEDLREI